MVWSFWVIPVNWEVEAAQGGTQAKRGIRMSSKDQLKRAVCEAIDRHTDTIIDLGETILRNPETGFNEVKTAALVAQRMSALGLEPRSGLALTGVKGRLARGTPRPRLPFFREVR